MGNKKLKNSPLKEVVFEVRWELPVDSNGIRYDPGFARAFGLFSQELHASFPVEKSMLPPNSVSDAYSLEYQLWSGELKWPVIGIGKGILSVNDREGNYVWDDSYRPAIESAIEALLKSYDTPLTFINLKLHYIDAVDVDDSESNSLDYVAKNFLIEIKNRFPLPGRHVGINLSQGFELDYQSKMKVQLQTATNNKTNKNALLWITQVERTNPIAASEVLDWLNQAHESCSKMFVDMLNPEFYASFDR